ncbi:hypothetical protein AB0H12_39960 [Actinosynnema sp. NPDC023794]
MPRAERPLDMNGSPLSEFAADLRKLRKKAGNPPYRELSRRAHYSSTTLSDAAGGHRLPSLEVTLAYVAACDGTPDEWRVRWHAVSAQLTDDRDERRLGVVDAPYVGLRAYGPADAGRFFGRERLLDDLMTRLDQRRLLAVFGPSGVGKSSILRAGLIPRLTDAGSGRVVLLTPGTTPVSELASHMAALSTRTVEENGAGLLVVVDQFEEVFTLCDDPAERSQFIELLIAAARADDRGCRVLIVTRSDFYARCAAHPDLAQAMSDGHFVIGAMSTDELREAIVRPSAAANCTVETALVTRLISEATGRPGVLPMVSHVLLETWRRRRGNSLTLSGYEAAGGIERAVAVTAEQVYEELDEAQQQLAKHLLIRLTALGQDSDDTRRKLHRKELDESGDLTVVLDRLTQARLLTVDHDSIEIGHEALLRAWPRLRAWLAEDREGLRIHRQLAEATTTWISLDHDPGALYRGGRLTSAEEWAAKNGHALTNAERQFLNTSLDTDARAHAADRRTARRLRSLVAVLCGLLVVAFTTSVLAVRSQRAMHDQRDNSLAQKALLEADRVQSVDPRLATQLRLAAHQMVPSASSRDGLLSHPTLSAVRLLGHDDALSEAGFSPSGTILATSSKDHTVKLWNVADPFAPQVLSVLRGHAGAVQSVAFSPDGLVLATAGQDRTVRLWDITNASEPHHADTLTGHTDQVLSVSFSVDGNTAITTSKDTTARLWDLTSGRPLSVLTGHTELVREGRLSPDGHTVATAGWDGTTRLWDVSDHSKPAQIAVLPNPTGRAQAVAFNPDGRLLATGGEDGITRVWDVSGPTAPSQVAALGGRQSSVEGVEAVAFSPDGATLAATGWARHVRLWDVTEPRSPRELGILTGHSSVVRSLAFSPDGRTLASASDDRTARLEDLRDLRAHSGHTDVVTAAAFSPEGNVLATGGVDSTVNLWATGPDGHLRRLARIDDHPDGVWSLAFDRTGKTLITAGSQGNILLWDVSSPAKPVRVTGFVGHAAGVNSLVVSPDNRTLITAGSDETIAVWDLSEPVRPRESARLREHDVPVQAVAITPDGRTAATAGADKLIKLWDVTDPRNPRPRGSLDKHTSGVGALAFNPTGTILASGGGDQTVRFWDTTNPSEVHEIATMPLGSPIETLAFSPDGTRFAVPGPGQAIQLWNVADPRNPTEAGTLSGHTGTVYAVAFNPADRTLVTTGANQAIRLWQSDLNLARERLCTMAAPVITPDEWKTHFPDADYQPPCTGN